MEGESYTYSCLAGYETSDSLTTQCLSDGSWSLATLPTCNSKCLLRCTGTNFRYSILVLVYSS